jgi:hypothetical protein
MKKLDEGKKSAVLQTLAKFIFKKTKFISRRKKTLYILLEAKNIQINISKTVNTPISFSNNISERSKL